jgi:anti-sigma factor ChrR (cupin superfamily)
MISEHQQEIASLYALGALPEAEETAFEAELRGNAELRELMSGLQRASAALALAAPRVAPPAELKAKVLDRIQAGSVAPAHFSQPGQVPPAAPGLQFRMADETSDWKQLPVPGAWIKLLSLQRDRGYAVLMGKLEPGVRYPAHLNAGPEDFCILTGDLHVGDRRLGPGDFHHADAGSHHDVNYSIAGCTLMAVLTVDHPLVAFAMA